MTAQSKTRRGRAAGPRAGVALSLLALGVAASLSACDSLLKVSNPNNVNAESLKNPAAANAMVDGALQSLTRAYGTLDAVYATAADEAENIGSRDDFNQLDRGNIASVGNEFTDNAFSFVGEMRWLAWSTAAQVEAFDAAGTLTDRNLLAQADLYAALAYNIVANTFDNFVLGDRNADAAQMTDLGDARMVALYDSAQKYIDKGLVVTAQGRTAKEQSDLAATKTRLLALSARNKFDKAVWKLLNPSGHVPANPLVNDAGAVADARAALAGGFGGDVRWVVTTTALTEGGVALGGGVKSGGYIATAKPLDTLADPITKTRDPAVAATLAEYNKSKSDTPMLVTSTREMLLILAEAALAQNDLTGFGTSINQIRDFNGLTHWTGAAGQPSARDLLIHERRVNLLFNFHRLNDLYRFGLKADKWAANEIAYTCPGILFPITLSERQSNPNVKGQPGCGQ